MDTKTKRRTPPREPGYHRLTDEKRIIIETLRKEGRSLAYIAERIGCSKSTVSKEIKRNKSKRGYRHKKANGQARARVAAKAAKRRKFTPEMWDYAITHLRDDGWTFEQSCGRARRDGIPMVCKETLYKEYYRRQDLVRRGCRRRSCPAAAVPEEAGSASPLRGAPCGDGSARPPGQAWPSAHIRRKPFLMIVRIGGTWCMSSTNGPQQSVRFSRDRADRRSQAACGMSPCSR